MKTSLEFDSLETRNLDSISASPLGSRTGNLMLAIAAITSLGSAGLNEARAQTFGPYQGQVQRVYPGTANCLPGVTIPLQPPVVVQTPPPIVIDRNTTVNNYNFHFHNNPQPAARQAPAARPRISIERDYYSERVGPPVRGQSGIPLLDAAGRLLFGPSRQRVEWYHHYYRYEQW